MGLKCTKANKTIPVSPTTTALHGEDISHCHKSKDRLDDYASEKKESSCLMVDHSMMGETIDREANNETAMKGEVVEAEFVVYMPR
jgi:hypothetical protein